VLTPELEAIGLMSDMLRLMYRFSVDALGSVISPIAVVVIYLFREQFEVSKYYGIRSTDLVYFLLFSAFLVPALWIIDIFLFNLQELLWNWKLFEYIQFCNERFANRTRRWVGLDNTINEELPPDLRALDQMCLSVQFYLLGSLHCSGIVFAVLGYMLVLHQEHNLFGDPMAIPLFVGVSLFLSLAKKAAIRVADRFRVWMVEGEYEHVEVYDEGPGSRKAGALPQGMAAVDATIADCIEDTFAAGYTEDHLVKLLSEAASFVPPGMSIQAMGRGGCDASFPFAAVRNGEEQRDAFLHSTFFPAPRVHAGLESAGLERNGVGTCTSTLGMANSFASVIPFQTPCQTNGMTQAGVQDESSAVGLPLGATPVAAMMPSGSVLERGAPAAVMALHLPAAVPPPPTGYAEPRRQAEDGEAFSEFISFFRKEMRMARAQDARATRFVHSTAAAMVEADSQKFSTVLHEVEEELEDDDYDYWPDFGLGIAQDDGHEALSVSTTSTTEGSSGAQQDSSQDEESQDDLWPIELLAT